jgi:digeranylgeranylglycerophospholipid reductase
MIYKGLHIQQGIQNTPPEEQPVRKFDVIVVGAGTAGSMTARTAAKAGLNVCLLDSKPRAGIGEKVCGDAVGKHHFDRLGISYPKGDEVGTRIEGIRIYSPDVQTVFTVKSETYGFILNRRLFGQRLLNEAVDAGATLLDSTIAVKPEVRDSFVTGVTAKDTRKNSTARLQSKVVVDASGFTAILRKCLPPEIGIDLHVSNEDVEACYREIRQLKGADFNQKYCEIYLDQTQTPGGYQWIFPEGGNRVNIGLGVAMVRGFPNPKNQFYHEILPHSTIKDSTVVKGGSWCVPTRRPLDCMTGNGIAMVGDSACQVNPIHGGGIGPSMMGGSLAGRTIVKAIEKDDVSRGGLWQYNVDYMKGYGAKQAGLDIFRLFLLKSIGNEEINYGMKYKLITEDDLLKVSEGQNLKLRITDKTKRAFYGLGKLQMLRRLRHAANLLNMMKTHYTNYPSSHEGFEKWRKRTSMLMKEANTRLSRSKA